MSQKPLVLFRENLSGSSDAFRHLSWDSFRVYDNKYRFSNLEKNILAIEALRVENEELYISLTSEIGIQNHAIDKYYKAQFFEQQYHEECFKTPNQLNIFLKAGGKFFQSFAEFYQTEDMDAQFFVVNNNSESAAQFAKSNRTIAHMDKAVLVDIYKSECFDTSGKPIDANIKKFNEYVLPYLFTNDNNNQRPIDPQLFQEMQLIHPLPCGWILSFLQQAYTPTIIEKNLNTQNAILVFENIDQPSERLKSMYFKEMVEVFLKDASDGLGFPEVLEAKKAMPSFIVEDFWGADWKSSWENDLVLLSAIQSTVSPQSNPLPTPSEFLDEASQTIRYFSSTHYKIAEYLSAFVVNHLALNSSILDNYTFSSDKPHGFKEFSEVLDLLVKPSEIFVQLTSGSPESLSVSLNRIENTPLNHPKVLANYFQWMALNGDREWSFETELQPHERHALINQHLLNMNMDTDNPELYFDEQMQTLKKEYKDQQKENETNEFPVFSTSLLENLNILQLSYYKYRLTKQILTQENRLIMQALREAKEMEGDWAFSMATNHITLGAVKPVSGEFKAKITPRF